MTRHFIVKHDLESFQEMPGFIWRINLPKSKRPRNFGIIKEGDRWIEFAYIKDEQDREPCSMITGFYECTKPHWYDRIPVEEGTLDRDEWEGQKAHLIKGKRCDGYQPRHPVTVPSIYQMLGRNIQPRVAVAPISADDFKIIRDETRTRELDPNRIPLLNREPLNEQQLLSVIIAGRETLGIESVIRVQTRFADMLVRIDGREVHLELEVDSVNFWDHIEKRQLRRVSTGKYKGKFAAQLRDDDDDRPVAILCWVDGDRKGDLRRSVPQLRIFELQSLLRDRNRLQWP